MFCQNCGKEIAEMPCQYCGFSGIRQPASQPTIIIQNNNANVVSMPVLSQKSKVTALLLCIFLGGIGVHRFYVGKTGTGILYLLTGGVFGIGWIVDIFSIAFGGFRDANGQFLK